MSRVLKTGVNQITQNYQAHYNKVKSGNGWAIGTDIVKKPAQCDYITAHSDGKVIKVVNYMDGTNCQLDKEGMGYGNYVMIEHENKVVTLYAHMTKVSANEGQKITKGTVIGFMGNTGNSSGAHLHFEIRKYTVTPTTALHDNKKFAFLNPEPYLDKDLPDQSVTIKYNYQGYLDAATTNTISGWCWNAKDNTACKVTIKVFNGSTVVKTLTTTANIYRADLKVAKKGNGSHGYSVKADFNGLADGIYTVKAYAPDGSQLTNEKSVVVESKKPLTTTSYGDYTGANDYYRVRKSFRDEKTSKGSYKVFKYAYNTWAANKASGYHLYDKDGKQLG